MYGVGMYDLCSALSPVSVIGSCLLSMSWRGEGWSLCPAADPYASPAPSKNR